MTIKYHLSNGCSFSTKKKYLSCHQKLGELLSLEPTMNLAKGGRGNDRCVQTTMHWFLKNPERMKDTFVSIGWSSGHRWDYIHKLKTQELIDRGVKGYKFEVAKFSRLRHRRQQCSQTVQQHHNVTELFQTTQHTLRDVLGTDQ
jgi:hypothetical protein